MAGMVAQVDAHVRVELNHAETSSVDCGDKCRLESCPSLLCKLKEMKNA